MVKRRVGGLVKAYVFYWYGCTYRVIALGCVDGIIMKSQNIEMSGSYTALYILIMIVTIAIVVWIMWSD